MIELWPCRYLQEPALYHGKRCLRCWFVKVTSKRFKTAKVDRELTPPCQHAMTCLLSLFLPTDLPGRTESESSRSSKIERTSLEDNTYACRFRGEHDPFQSVCCSKEHALNMKKVEAPGCSMCMHTSVLP